MIFFVFIFILLTKDSIHFDNLINLDIYLPTKCESCIIFAREFELLTSHLPKQTRKEDEGWLIGQLEIFCERMLEYRLHRERTGVNRFSKESTKIAKLAHNLEKRGVELKLDVPTILLNEPTVESDLLRRHCEGFIEDLEIEIEEWFFEHRNISLEKYLCAGSFTKRFDPKCSKNEAIVNKVTAKNDL